MEKRRDLNPTEMKFLNYLGKHPEFTNKEFAQLLQKRNPSYVSTLKRELEEKQYFVGPYYQTDYGKIFKNRVRKTVAIIFFEKSYTSMLSLLKSIECFSYFFPIEERFFRSYMMGVFDSDTEAIKRIFEYLKREGIIFHYELYLQDYQTHVSPPFFLKDSEETSFDPPLNNLLEETEFVDLSFSRFEGFSLSGLEQILIPYLEQGVSRLTDVMKKEQEKGNFFTYAEWKASCKRLLAEKIIQPVYDIFPLPYNDCFHFYLLLRADDFRDTQKLLLNFGKDSRLYKKIFVWTSFRTGSLYGVIYCISHPEFTIKLLMQLDAYKEIKEKKFFVLRKTFSLWEGKSISMEFYNPESRSLYYPYDFYLEKVKAFVEELL